MDPNNLNPSKTQSLVMRSSTPGRISWHLPVTSYFHTLQQPSISRTWNQSLCQWNRLSTTTYSLQSTWMYRLNRPLSLCIQNLFCFLGFLEPLVVHYFYQVTSWHFCMFIQSHILQNYTNYSRLYTYHRYLESKEHCKIHMGNAHTWITWPPHCL